MTVRRCVAGVLASGLVVTGAAFVVGVAPAGAAVCILPNGTIGPCPTTPPTQPALPLQPPPTQAPVTSPPATSAPVHTPVTRPKAFFVTPAAPAPATSPQGFAAVTPPPTADTTPAVTAVTTPAPAPAPPTTVAAPTTVAGPPPTLGPQVGLAPVSHRSDNLPNAPIVVALLVALAIMVPGAYAWWYRTRGRGSPPDQIHAQAH